MLFVCIAVLSEINAIVTLVHEKVLLMYLPTTGLCPLLASHVSYATVLMAYCCSGLLICLLAGCFVPEQIIYFFVNLIGGVIQDSVIGP